MTTCSRRSFILLVRLCVVVAVVAILSPVVSAEEGKLQAHGIKHEKGAAFFGHEEDEVLLSRALSVSCLPAGVDDPSYIKSRELNIMDKEQDALMPTWKNSCRKTRRCVSLKRDIPSRGSPSFRRFRRRFTACVTRCRRNRKQIRDAARANNAQQQPPCTPCADGSEPSHDFGENSIIYTAGSGRNITCQILLDDVFATMTTVDVTSGRCAGWQETFAYYCGCEPPPPEDKVCPLCPNGDTVADLDLSLDVPFVSGTCSCTSNCRSALVAAASSETTEKCLRYQQIGLLFCGCPVPEERKQACPLCGEANGVEVNLPDPDQAAVSENVSCDMMARVSRIQNTTNDDCKRFQSTVGGYCNCPNVADPSMDANTTCRLCGNQTLPDPLRVVDALFVGNITCAAFEFTLNHEPGVLFFGCETSASFATDCCQP